MRTGKLLVTDADIVHDVRQVVDELSLDDPKDVIVTARICGICPVAYQMSACLAIEAACGIEVTAPIADLRRLLYCGEWIESHALHIYLLHAPDFLGEQAIRNYDPCISCATHFLDLTVDRA